MTLKSQIIALPQIELLRARVQGKARSVEVLEILGGH